MYMYNAQNVVKSLRIQTSAEQLFVTMYNIYEALYRGPGGSPLHVTRLFIIKLLIGDNFKAEATLSASQVIFIGHQVTF